MKKLTLAILIGVCALSCKDKESNPFEGITETDGNCIINGSIDETDWNVDEEWAATEISLFPSLSLMNYNNNGIDPSYDVGHWIGCPNPAIQGLSIYFRTSKEVSQGKFVVIDPSYNILIEKSFGDEVTISLNFSEFSDDESLRGYKGYLRIYYIYQLTNDDFFYKGHGDFIIE